MATPRDALLVTRLSLQDTLSKPAYTNGNPVHLGKALPPEAVTDYASTQRGRRPAQVPPRWQPPRRGPRAMRKTHVLLLLFVSLIHFGFRQGRRGGIASPAAWLDLTNAVVLTPAELSGPEKKAVTMLVEEVERRSGVRWEVATALPGETSVHRGGTGLAPAGQSFSNRGLARPRTRIERARRATGSRPKSTAHGVLVAGNDPRGVLFGVGRLLRELRMTRGGCSCRGISRRDRAPVSRPRPPARLSPQDQLVRRLGPGPVGAVHSRPRRLRHQRHRADPPAF